MEYYLSDLFDLEMGKTPSRSNPTYWKNPSRKWISIGDLSHSGKFISKTKEWISEEAVRNSGIKEIPANTVVMSFKLSIGKTAITAEPMFSNEAIMSFRDKHVVDILPDYIYYMFSGLDWNKGTNKAVKGKTLNKTTLSRFKIKVHNIHEQRKIVNILDKVCDIIKIKKDQLGLLEDLAKSRFFEMFGDIVRNEKGWPVFRMDTITTSRLGKMLDSKKQTGEYRFPYLANVNVQWFHFDLSDLKEMDFNEDDQKEFELKDGDLLVCEGGEIGRCAVWHDQIQPCYFQKALHRIRCNKSVVLPEYLSWWFRESCDRNAFQRIVGGKATIAHLPGEKLKKLEVVVPSLSLQRQFVLFVKKVSELTIIIQQSLDKTQLLFDSLLQKYFG